MNTGIFFKRFSFFKPNILFRDGTRKGLDVSLGLGSLNQLGGVLIRTIEVLGTGE